MPRREPPSALSRLREIRRLVDVTPRGLIVDVDGTISEIAPAPAQARVSAICREHLRALLDTFDVVAAVSGRSVVELQRMIGLDRLVLVGNHGLERWEGGRLWVASAAKRAAAMLPGVLDQIETQLGPISGLILERKTYGLAIHYRSAANPEAVRQSIMEAMRAISYSSHFSIQEGRKVVELRPRGRIQKGWAVRDLIRRHGVRCVIYLGDDVTDADAFGVIRRSRRQGQIQGVTIAVLNPETPSDILNSADLALEGVGEVESFLEKLLDGSAC